MVEKKSDKKLSNEEIDLYDFFIILWDHKKIIASITLLFFILTVFYSLTINDHYRSESILASVNSQSSSSLSQYTDLAAIAGVSIPGSGEDQVSEMIEIIKSREFVKHLLGFDDILPALIAAESFEAGTGRIKYNADEYNSSTKEWIREPKGNKGNKPSYLEAHREYIKIISISRDLKTGLVHISLEHLSPIFAKDLLTLVIREANNLKRSKDLNISSNALNYLQNELSRTSLSEVKLSINQLIESQLERQMMAKINEDYSLVVIDPPFVPDLKSKPKRSLIVILGTLLGCLIAISFVLLRYFFQRDLSSVSDHNHI